MTRYKNITLLTLALGVSGCTDTSFGYTDEAIFGGSPTNISSIPWQVSIQDRAGNHICGGSIVAASWIATSQSCLNGAEVPPESNADLRIVAGITNLSASATGQIREVDAISRHAAYSTSLGPHYDVALLHLATPLTLDGGNARAIQILTTAQAAAGHAGTGSVALASGWGRLDDGTYPDDLRSTSTFIAASPADPDLLVAGGSGHSGCFRDAGGPLTVIVGGEPRLAGIHSYFGNGCGAEQVYARVSHLDDWIAEITTSPVTKVLDLRDITGDGAFSRHVASFTIPSGMKSISFVLHKQNLAATGTNADLSVRRGDWPTTITFDCHPGLAGSDEACTWDTPVGGTYYVAIGGLTPASPVSLTGYVVGAMNLATGATAGAYSTYEGSGWSLQSVVDGNPNSVPGAMGYSSRLPEGANHTEYLTLDLETARPVSGIVLHPRNDAGYAGEGFPIDFKIQVWNGSAWLDRVTVTNYTKPASVPQLFTWNTPDTTSRIRVYATKLRPIGLNYLLQLAEVEIYNPKPPTITTGATVSVSSAYTGSPGWASAKLVDRTTNSVAGGMGHSSQLFQYSNHTEWVEVRLPSQRRFSSVTLYPRNDPGMVGEGFPIDFKIQVWDGANWLDRVAVTDYAKPGNLGQVFTWGFHDVTDRIRIYATKLRPVGTDYLLQLAEVEINDPIVVANLAAGSRVSASSEYAGSPGWARGTIADNITSSVAGSMGHSSQLFQYADHTEWVELSLPSIRTFSGIALHPRNDAGMIGEGFPVDFQLQVWDGANWLTRVAETGFAKPGNAAQIFRWGFSDTTDRVRINATSLRPVGPDYLLQLAELRVLE